MKIACATLCSFPVQVLFSANLRTATCNLSYLLELVSLGVAIRDDQHYRPQSHPKHRLRLGHLRHHQCGRCQRGAAAKRE